MSKINFTNIRDEENYESQRILTAAQLNASFRQPDITTSALLKVLNENYSDNQYTSETSFNMDAGSITDLKNIISNCLRGITQATNGTDTGSYLPSKDLNGNISLSLTFSTSGDTKSALTIDSNGMSIKSKTGIEISNDGSSANVYFSSKNGTSYNRIKSRNGVLSYETNTASTYGFNFDTLADIIHKGNIQLSNDGNYFKIDNGSSRLTYNTFGILRLESNSSTDSSPRSLLEKGEISLYRDANNNKTLIQPNDYTYEEDDEEYTINYQRFRMYHKISNNDHSFVEIRRSFDATSATDYPLGILIARGNSEEGTQKGFVSIDYNGIGISNSNGSQYRYINYDFINDVNTTLTNKHAYFISLSGAKPNTGSLSSKTINLYFYLLTQNEMTEYSSSTYISTIFSMIYNNMIITSNDRIPCSGDIGQFSSQTIPIEGIQLWASKITIYYRETNSGITDHDATYESFTVGYMSVKKIF